MTDLEGLDLAALDRHLREVGVPRSGELRAELIAGGRSNLTFLVGDDASQWVLRRPPLHGLTPSAHDMAREYRVVAALADTAVPVARAVTMRNDDSVLGAPFQMVEYVAGRVVRHTDQLRALGDDATIEKCVDALIAVLADLHSVDPDAVGLSDFGKPSGYLERQVRRWGSQWDLVKQPDDPCDADVRKLHQRLAEALPPQSRTSIVHGDYRIDNTILDNEDHFLCRGMRSAAAQVYGAAGMTPKDVDVLLVSDASTVAIPLTLENYGFCEEGGSPDFIRSGAIGPGGSIPVNTHGGQLSEGYLVGWLHHAELVRQLRGECGERQVPGARVAQYTTTGRFREDYLSSIYVTE